MYVDKHIGRQIARFLNTQVERQIKSRLEIEKAIIITLYILNIIQIDMYINKRIGRQKSRLLNTQPDRKKLEQEIEQAWAIIITVYILNIGRYIGKQI